MQTKSCFMGMLVVGIGCEFSRDTCGKVWLLSILRTEWACNSNGNGGGSMNTDSYVRKAEDLGLVTEEKAYSAPRVPTVLSNTNCTQDVRLIAFKALSYIRKRTLVYVSITDVKWELYTGDVPSSKLITKISRRACFPGKVLRFILPPKHLAISSPPESETMGDVVCMPWGFNRLAKQIET